VISANPKFHAQFSDNSGDAKVDLDEMPLLKTIIDRLDLILIFKPEANEQGIRDYIDQKTEQEDRPVRNYDTFLRKLMLYCRSLNPVVDEKAKSIIKESYVRISAQVKQNNLSFGSHRLADTLFRITRAIARLKLKKVADATDARQAIEFYNSMIMQTIGVIVIPEEPQDVAVKVMLDILKDKAKLNDIYLRELAELACQQTAQVKSYLRGSHNDTGANSRLREIANILLNHSSVRKGEREKPLTLRWVDSNNSNSSATTTTEIEESSSEKVNVSAHLQRPKCE
jgi:DNA replicative helicase MCM subunit Mcm2 (Cdc46/Mcm family)